MTTYYQQIAKVLVFMLIFGTVAPVSLLAVDSVEITNTAYSSSNSGGQSSSGQPGKPGQAGQAGQDGQDGQDGQPGKPGTDGANIKGESTASVHVESTINGERVVDIYESNTGESNATASVATEFNTEVPSSTDSVVLDPEGAGLLSVLESLRLMLF